jgi:hypothetical protein
VPAHSFLGLPPPLPRPVGPHTTWRTHRVYTFSSSKCPAPPSSLFPFADERSPPVIFFLLLHRLSSAVTPPNPTTRLRTSRCHLRSLTHPPSLPLLNPLLILTLPSMTLTPLHQPLPPRPPLPDAPPPPLTLEFFLALHRSHVESLHRRSFTVAAPPLHCLCTHGEPTDGSVAASLSSSVVVGEP